MAQHLTALKKAKPTWSWKDDDCILALADALRNEQSSDAIAKRLMRSYAGALTKSAVNGALNRKANLDRLRKLVPDADKLLEVYRARSAKAQGARNRQTNAKLKAGGLGAFRPPANGPPTKPGKMVVLPEDLPPLQGADGSFITTNELTERMCVFPYERGRETVFCGRRRERGSYCAEHGKIVYQPKSKT